jgi:3'-5' exoribonuclease
MNYINHVGYPSRISELIVLTKTFGVKASFLSKETFSRWSGASKPEQHHYGNGGLQFHTWEVVTLCQRNADFLESLGQTINRKTLFCAALYHDSGKLFDYSPLPDGINWVGTSHKRLVHHISRSAMTWMTDSATMGLPTTEVDDVLHCILSHHGRREWGSPVAPFSREAWLLHLCDSISARGNDCETNRRIE